jgi:alpha-L-rhamnosidase
MTAQEAIGLPSEQVTNATVSPVRFEHRDCAMGIGTATPRLSWQVVTDDSDWSQTAYEVELGGTVVRVTSADQILAPWPFEPLKSRQHATVRVRVASRDAWSEWSDPSTVEAGLLTPQDWTARFISPTTIGGVGQAAPALSRTVNLRSGIASARLYSTAHGVYIATLNGTRVGDEVLAPGWTSYQHRLRYQTYDVTNLLREGRNTFEVLLGNGWYRGRISWRAVYGERLAALAQLEVTYDDGSTETIATDEQWTAYESGILGDDLYDGQRTDLRLRHSAVDKVEAVEADLGTLVAPEGPPVRMTEIVPAVRVWQSPSGKTLADFGQNLVGWVRLHANGMAGNEVVVRHAEVLEHDEIAVRFLGSAKATDSYILPDGSTTLEPTFTFHGFRYAEISGIPNLSAEDVAAVVIGTDLRRTGWFSCSDPDLNQFHDNVVWSMRGNFLDIPTDCPQRNERVGWTEDIQVFSPTASFLFDTAGFLSSWLADLAAEQYPDGTVPFVIPDILGIEVPATAAWSDAATVVPWVLYQRYGDPRILERQYESMRAWVDKAASLTRDGVWSGGFQFGDWLDPTAPADRPFDVKADPDVIATAYLARSADIVAETAQILGHGADVAHYLSLAGRTRDAFTRHYVTGTGRVLSDAATVYALAIEWTLLPTAEQRAHAGKRLADLVRANGFRIATGFVGTPLITDALCTAGYPDQAYRLLLERGCPSWLYPISMGATTVWERWDGVLPDGRTNVCDVTSFNHYAFGAVADWIHRVVAGLAPAAPGYREIVVHPRPHPALTHAAATHHTPFGKAAVAWSRENGQFSLDLSLPVGTRATVHLPGTEPLSVGHGRHTWAVDEPSVAKCAPKTVRDLIDSPDAWAEAVSQLMADGLGKDAAEVARRLARYLEAPASELQQLLVMESHAIAEPQTPQPRGC